MGQSTIKNSRRIFTTAGGDPSLPDRVIYLENNEYKILYFQSISATTGTITKPTNSTILLDQFYEGGDAIVETLINGQPSEESPLTAGGAVVSVSSFDTSGNYTLSGTPSSYPVALVYILKIKAVDYQNLTTANIMAMDEISSVSQTITNGVTDKSPSEDAVYDALALRPIATKHCGAFANTNPADNSTQYIGTTAGIGLNGTATNRQFYLKTGTLKVVNATFYSNTILGSNENVTINLRNITDATSTLIGTITMDVLSSSKVFTGLSIATDSTKLYSIEIVTPAWVTNPTATQYSLELEIY